MSLIFKPYGNLDVTTDPSSLPQDQAGNDVLSGEMTRCKNLRLDESGTALTRDGSSKLNSTSIRVIYNMIEQGGVRYALGDTVYRNESSIGSGYSSQWSSILYNPYNSTTQNVYALNGTNKIRIEGSTVYNWGIETPTVPPTIAVGSLTGLTGDYNAKYSYCRKEGSTVVSESNLSPSGGSVTLANESLSVTWTASSDPQVTHVRVYRSIADGLIYYHDQDIAIGTLTVDSNTSDAGLGDQEHTTHTRPPAGTTVIGPSYNGTCFILKDNLVYYCLAKQPDYWPGTYYIEACPAQLPLKAGAFYNGQLYVANKAQIIQIAGTGAQTFFPIPTQAVGGTVSRYGMCSVLGLGIFHVLSDGIYQFTTASDKKITYGQFEKIFRGEDAGAMPGMGDASKSWIIEFENQIYFGYASKTNVYPQHVIIYNLESKRATYYDWGIEISAICVDRENSRLLAASTTGYVWHIENGSLDTDAGNAIEWDIQSKDFTMSTRAHYPRWIKYDVNASTAVSATGQVILDGSVLQSHTITGNRITKRRLINTDNGEKCAMRIHGSGPVSIYAMESE